jgi:hypothetical protein
MALPAMTSFPFGESEDDGILIAKPVLWRFPNEAMSASDVLSTTSLTAKVPSASSTP